MARDLPRRTFATSEGQNPQRPNLGHTVDLGNVAGGSNVPEPEVPMRTGKEPMLSEDPANQDYSKGGDD